MQPDLFEYTINHLAGDKIPPTPELIEQEHRGVYIQQALLGVTLVKSAEDILKQARRSFTHAGRVASLYNEEDQYKEVAKALGGIEKGLKNLDHILSGKA